jgi:hypothetical protein
MEGEGVPRFSWIPLDHLNDLFEAIAHCVGMDEQFPGGSLQ